MNIRFREISRGIVEARASVEVAPGIVINEITILKKGNDLVVEYPQKTFKGNDGKIHYVDIVTFASEQKRIVWSLEIIDAYINWREANKPVLVYKPE